jgi:hypothetical protein
LRADAFVDIHLIIEIFSGSISKIDIKYSLTSIFSKPIKILINDVFILIKLKDVKEKSMADLAIEQTKKLLSKLQTVFKSQLLFETVVEEKNRGMFKRLWQGAKNYFKGYFADMIQSVLANLEFEIQNIHIRYEDVNLPTSMGIVIEKVSLMGIQTD